MRPRGCRTQVSKPAAAPGVQAHCVHTQQRHAPLRTVFFQGSEEVPGVDLLFLQLANVPSTCHRVHTSPPGWNPSICEWYFSRQLASESWSLHSCGVQPNKERAAVTSVVDRKSGHWACRQPQDNSCRFSGITWMAGCSVIQESKTTADHLNRFAGL